MKALPSMVRNQAVACSFQRKVSLKVLTLRGAVCLKPHPTAYIQDGLTNTLALLLCQHELGYALACTVATVWSRWQGGGQGAPHKPTGPKAKWRKLRIRVHRGTQTGGCHSDYSPRVQNSIVLSQREKQQESAFTNKHINVERK